MRYCKSQALSSTPLRSQSSAHPLSAFLHLLWWGKGETQSHKDVSRLLLAVERCRRGGLEVDRWRYEYLPLDETVKDLVGDVLGRLRREVRVILNLQSDPEEHAAAGTGELDAVLGDVSLEQRDQGQATLAVYGCVRRVSQGPEWTGSFHLPEMCGR